MFTIDSRQGGTVHYTYMKQTDVEVLPALADSYQVSSFTPVNEADDDKTTTQSDLDMLNNHLAACAAALPKVYTIGSLCMLSATVAKLIEVRRKVKKLPYGNSAGTSRTFEWIE